MASHRHPNEYSEVLQQYEPSVDSVGAFSAKPIDVHFSTQQKSEHILLLLRQHPVTQLRGILIIIVLIVLPLLFYAVDFFAFLPLNYMLAVLMGWYLVVTGFILETFLKWFYNIYIVTDERVVDIDFESLIYRRVSSASLDNIEDVTKQIKGVMAALFDYGNVFVQTAAQQREFDFLSVPKPTQVTRLINELMIEKNREQSRYYRNQNRADDQRDADER